MAEERINAGYKIIESLKATDEMEYVIGQSISAPSQYVTWRYMREQNTYYAGTYCNSLLQARKSLLERALTSVNHAMPANEPTVPENAISRDINGEQMVFELSGDEMDHIWDIVDQENIINDIKHRIRERDDFEDNVKETVISDNEILIDEIGRKFRSDVGMGGESFWYTLDDYIDEKLPEFKIPRFSKVPLYLESWEYACLNNEREQYNQSLQETIKCRDDMQKDISEHFDGYHIPVERAINYINDYGYERVMVVLANTIQQNEWDASISAYNKDWAKSVLVPDAEKNSRRILLSCGTGLVDGVTSEVRRLYAAENQSKKNEKEEWAAYGDENFAESGGLLLRHVYSEAERAANPSLNNKFDVVALYVDKEIDDTIENRNVIWQGTFDLDDFMNERDTLAVEKEYGTDFHSLTPMDNSAIIINLEGAAVCGVSPMTEYTSSSNEEVRKFLDEIGFSSDSAVTLVDDEEDDMEM